MAFQEFSDWLETNESQLNTLCHCCPPKQSAQSTNINKTTTATINTNWKSVIEKHRIINARIQQEGNRLCFGLKRFLEKDKTNTITKDDWDKASAMYERWKKLWFTSLEQLIMVETTRKCPLHSSTKTTCDSPITNSKLPITNCNQPLTNCNSPAHDKRLLIRRTNRIRPFSYPNNNERLEWDYQNTLNLQGCHKENGSHLDLDSVDELETKKLTEFGENYEVWFGKEDEIANISVHSRPSSVEPAEEPEIATAVVSSSNDVNFNGDVNYNLLMLTTQPSVVSIDGSKYSPRKRAGRAHWVYITSAIFVIFIVMITNIFREPHQMYKSYQYSQPPV